MNVQSFVAALPNALSLFRIAASPGLVALAAAGFWSAAWTLMLLVLLSDLFDGPIARRFSAETRHGALLDTVADIIMYSAISLAALIYSPEVLRTYVPWIGLAVGSYFLHVLICTLKFRRWPSYHTRLAKSGWLFILLALIGVVSAYADWLVLIAAIVIIITNVEGILITLLTPEYRDNIPGAFHLLN